MFQDIPGFIYVWLLCGHGRIYNFTLYLVTQLKSFLEIFLFYDFRIYLSYSR